MAQFDVHLNNSPATSSSFPYLVEVQSEALGESARVVIVPLISQQSGIHFDEQLNPAFVIDNSNYVFFPLDIASVNRQVLGATVGSIASDSDKVVAALDLLFARY